MSGVTKLLNGCGNINRLTVSPDGNINVIGKWDLIGRFVRWLHRDLENAAVINKIREILTNDGIQTIHGLDTDYTVEELNPETGSTPARINALLNGTAFPAIPLSIPPPAEKKMKLVDLKKDKTDETVVIRYRNISFYIDEKVANKLPTISDAIGDTKDKEIFLDPNNPAISERAIRDAIQFKLNPPYPPAEVMRDSKRMIEMTIFLNYMGVDTDILADLVKTYVREDIGKVHPEFLIDVMLENRAFYENCLMPLEIGHYDLEKIQNQQAKFLFSTLNEANCLKHINFHHGNLVLDINQFSNLTEAQLKCLIMCLNMFPKHIRIRLDVAAMRGNEDRINELLHNTTNKVILDNPALHAWHDFRIKKILKSVLNHKRVDLVSLSRYTPEYRNYSSNVPKIEIKCSEDYSPGYGSFKELQTTKAMEVVFDDENGRYQGGLRWFLERATQNPNIKHLKITSNSFQDYPEYYNWLHINPGTPWNVAISPLESLEMNSKSIATARDLLNSFVGKTPNLKNLSINCSEDTRIRSSVLVDVLRSSPNLTHLYMKNITSRGNVRQFIDVLSNHPSLTTINGMDKESFIESIEDNEKRFRSIIEHTFPYFPGLIAKMNIEDFIRSLNLVTRNTDRNLVILKAIVSGDPGVAKALQGEVEPQKLKEQVLEVFKRITTDPSSFHAYIDIALDKLGMVVFMV